MPYDRIIDLYWGNSFSLKAIQKAGVKAIIHKTSEGTFLPLSADKKKYAERKKIALDAGLLWGAYHLPTDEDPKAQFEHFISYEDGSDANILLALDWERAKNQSLMSLDQVHEYLELFSAHFGGRLPVIYGGWVIRENPTVLHGDTRLGLCPLWYQQYSKHSGLLPTNAEPLNLPTGTWDDYTIWQYANEHPELYGGPADANLGGADWNRYRGTFEELKKAWPFSKDSDPKTNKELLATSKKLTERWKSIILSTEEAQTENATESITGPAAGGFASRLVASAVAEWEFFGGQTRDRSGHTTKVGHKEGENGYWQRVGTYWSEGLGNHNVDGRDDVPWSAAFISWNEKKAGAGNRFYYNALHAQYIYKSIRDYLQGVTGVAYYGRRLTEWKPQLGDLICWERDDSKDTDYDHQHHGTYYGHCDIVVAVNATEIDVIGGNVGNSVTRRTFALNSNGYLVEGTLQDEYLFAIMQNILG